MKAIENIFTQQNKSTLKWVASGFLIFGIVYIAKKTYNTLVYKQKKQKKTSTSPIKKTKKSNTNSSAQRLNTKITEYSQYYFDKDMQIKNIETLIPEDPSVEDIYLNSPIIARDQFIKYTYQMRKRRRLIRKINQDQYINVILMYQGSRIELIQQLGMDVDNFENMEQNYEAIQDIRALHKKSEQALRYKLITDTKQKKMTNQKLKQIIQQQLCFMRNKMYDRLRQKLLQQKINQNDILIIVNTLLQDIIYEKFGYESQDIERKIQEIGYDTTERDQTRVKMERDIGGFSYQSFQSQSENLSDVKQTKSSRNRKIIKGQILKQTDKTLNNSESGEEKQ